MKIIDSKGRLFGRINIIDLIFLLLLIIVIVAGYRFLNQPKFLSLSDEKLEPVHVQISNQPMYILNNIKVGDEVFDEGRNIGTITEKHITKIESIGADAIVKLNLKVARDTTDRPYFSSKPLKIGTPLTLSTKILKFTGTVMGINKKGFSTRLETLQVKIIIRGMEPWYVDSVKINDHITNDNNKIIARVSDVQTKSSALIIQPLDGSGYLAIQNHADRSDIIVTLELEALILNDVMYYQGQELKIGNQLKLSTSNVALRGDIIEILVI